MENAFLGLEERLKTLLVFFVVLSLLGGTTLVLLRRSQVPVDESIPTSCASQATVMTTEGPKCLPNTLNANGGLEVNIVRRQVVP